MRGVHQELPIKTRWFGLANFDQNHIVANLVPLGDQKTYHPSFYITHRLPIPSSIYLSLL